MSLIKQISRTILLALFLQAGVLPRATSIVVGQITDSHGIPIAYAEVYLPSERIGTTTNRDGRFLLPLTHKPRGTIIIKHSAFVVKEVALDTLSSHELSITLATRTYQFDPVVVQGNLYGRESLRLPVTHRVVPISGSQNGGNSVAERLDRMGIQVRDYGGPAGLKTAASPTGYAEHILVMVESLPLNSPQNGVYDFSVLPADLFSHGEFYLGHGSSLYGPNAIGGTLNLMVDDALSYLRIRTGSFGEKGFSGQGVVTIEPLSLSIYHNRYETQGDFRENNDFSQHATGIQATLPLGYRWTARTFALRSTSRRGIAGSLQFPSLSARKENDDIIALATFRGLSRFGQSELILGTTRSDEHFTNADWMVDSRHRVETSRIRIVHRLNEMKSVRHIFSVDLTQNHVDSDDAGDHRESLGSIGLLSEIRLGSGVILSPGVRAEWNSRPHNTIVTGSMAVLWNREKSWLHSLLANAGTSYRYPTYNDLFWKDPSGFSAGNPELKDERGVSADISIGVQPPGNEVFRGDIRAYYFFTHDLIQWAPDENWVYSPQNLGKTESYGGSVILNVLPGAFPLHFTVGTEQNQSRILSPGEDNGKRLLYVPAVFHWVEMDFETGPVKLNMSYRFLGKRRYSYQEVSYLKSYDRLDIDLVFRGPHFARQQMTLNIGARNLQDRKRLQSVYGYPEPGRTLFAVLSLGFQ